MKALFLMLALAVFQYFPPGVQMADQFAKCEPVECKHESEDLGFLDLRVTDVRKCEFSYEGRRGVGILQLSDKFVAGIQVDAKTYVKVEHKLVKGDVGTVLFCRLCNTALAITMYEKGK